MRSLRRVVLIVLGALALLALCAGYIVPVGWSIYSAHRTAREFPNVNQVPVALPDLSVSHSPGTKLSYLGFEFEVPWTDLDVTQTKQTPGRVVLEFHSGLILSLAIGPPNEWQHLSHEKWHPEEALFGREVSSSDYRMFKALYSITPSRLYRLSFHPASYYRDDILLTLKATALIT
jgi:hypothetical protein